MLNKVKSFAARCHIKSLRLDKGIALCQIQDGANQELKDVPTLQQWGFASVPTADSMGIALRVGGDRKGSIVIATDSNERPDLRPGETAIYSDKWMIKLLDDGVSISAKSGQEIFKVTGDKSPAQYQSKPKSCEVRRTFLLVPRASRPTFTPVGRSRGRRG